MKHLGRYSNWLKSLLFLYRIHINLNPKLCLSIHFFFKKFHTHWVLALSCISLKFKLELSWSCPVFVLNLSWFCPGFVLELSWSCPGTVTKLSWNCHEVALELSRSCLKACFFLVQNQYRQAVFKHFYFKDHSFFRTQSVHVVLRSCLVISFLFFK